MECESMLFVKNHIPYHWDLSNSFSNSFIDFYSCEGFHQVIYQEEWSIKLRIDNGGWHETLNWLHVSWCEMLHFLTSYMKQNRSRKQTLESAQYGLEISFNSCHKQPKLLTWSPLKPNQFHCLELPRLLPYSCSLIGLRTTSTLI